MLRLWWINLKRYTTSVSIYFDTWKYAWWSLRLFNLVGYNINDIKIAQQENTTILLFMHSFLDILRPRNSKNFVHFRSADAIKANYRSILTVTHHDRLLHVCSSLNFYSKEFKFHIIYGCLWRQEYILVEILRKWKIKCIHESYTVCPFFFLSIFNAKYMKNKKHW